MKRYIFVIFLASCSILSVYGQTDDYAKLASQAFNNGSYSQALVYCSMYAAEKSERLPIEKDIKLCLEYERQFDDAVMNENVSLAKIFSDKIIALNPNDKRIRNRLLAIETQMKQTRAPQQTYTALYNTQSRHRAKDYFNFEATIVKDLELNFSKNYSCLLIGVNYGIDLWNEQRVLTDPEEITPDYYYTDWKQTELSRPAHLMVHGGLSFKYFAVDCGVGYVFTKTRIATYSIKSESEDCTSHEHSNEKRVRFFTFRPEVKVFIPFESSNNDCHWIFTFGYNVVNDERCLEGITISTGCGWTF